MGLKQKRLSIGSGRRLLFDECGLRFGWCFCVNNQFLFLAVIDKESGFGFESQLFEPSAGERDGGCAGFAGIAGAWTDKFS